MPLEPTTNPTLERRRRPAGTLLGAAALSLGLTACGVDLIGGGEADTDAAQPTPITKMTETSVRSFYALASEAYRTRDAEQLCAMHHEAYVDDLLEQAAASGVNATTCPELWRIVFAADPDGYADQLSKIRVKGKTATFRSGGDPWRVRIIRGEMKVVAPK